jgi:hypothetical protein
MKPLLAFFCLVCTVAPLREAGAADQPKPNIVFILVDDMRWHDVSVHMKAGNPGSAMAYIKMPHVERLAVQGMTFHNARAAAFNLGPGEEEGFTFK